MNKSLSKQSYEGQMKDSMKTSKTFLVSAEEIGVTESREQIKVGMIGDEDEYLDVEEVREIRVSELDHDHTIDEEIKA